MPVLGVFLVLSSSGRLKMADKSKDRGVSRGRYEHDETAEKGGRVRSKNVDLCPAVFLCGGGLAMALLKLSVERDWHAPEQSAVTAVP
jgi:hypothetical protein